ncbi:hypothetical protein [Dolosigranulum pigrum]|uniref:hypothetical protein n=1 Tax=Dolosigranulum pigrum TaxID=29394 RepID=UPI00248BFFF5|nr:hypothetical protein [Dolosigranulum pigrum]
MSLMSLAGHSALNYTSDTLGCLTYYYVFKNGSEANVVRHSEDKHGRLIYDVFYRKTDEQKTRSLLNATEVDVLLLLNYLDEGDEACGAVRV